MGTYHKIKILKVIKNCQKKNCRKEADCIVECYVSSFLFYNIYKSRFLCEKHATEIKAILEYESVNLSPFHRGFSEYFKTIKEWETK